MSFFPDSPQNSPTTYSPLPNSAEVSEKAPRRKGLHGLSKEEANNAAVALALIRVQNLPVGELIEVTVTNQRFLFENMGGGKVKQLKESELSQADNYKIVRARFQKEKKVSPASTTPKLEVSVTMGTRGQSITSTPRKRVSEKNNSEKQTAFIAKTATLPSPDDSREKIKAYIEKRLKEGEYCMLEGKNRKLLIGKNLKGKSKILDFTNPRQIGEGTASIIFSVDALHVEGKKGKAYKISTESEEERQKSAANIKLINPTGKTPWFPAIRDYKVEEGVIMPLYKLNLLQFCDKYQLSLSLLTDAVLAAKELQARGVVHGDLKPPNFFIAEKKGKIQLKIGDLDGITFLKDLTVEDIIANYQTNDRITPSGMFMTPAYVSEKDLAEMEHLLKEMQNTYNHWLSVRTAAYLGTQFMEKTKNLEDELEVLLSEYKRRLAAFDSLALGLSFYNALKRKAHPAQDFSVDWEKLSKQVKLNIPDELAIGIQELIHPDFERRMTIAQFTKIWLDFVTGPQSPLTTEERSELDKKLVVLEQNIKQYTN